MSYPGKIQSIDRAINILKCFTENRSELRLSDISEMLDLNKSTAHGILATLKHHGLVEQNKDTQMYSLGLELITLGERVVNSMDIIKLARPFIKELSLNIEETVHLGILDNQDIVYIDKFECKRSVRITTSVGARMPAYCTGMGKVLISHLKEDKLLKSIPRELKKNTYNTIVDRTSLIKELSRVRECGYAIDNEETVVGMTCVAAPIFNNEGKAKYAISVSGPTSRMDFNKLEQIKQIIKEISYEISLELGYSR